MAKLRLDGTSPSPSPYSDFTSKYRTSNMIEDRRDVTKSEQPSRTPKDLRSLVQDTIEPGSRGSTPKQKYGTADENTPDDYGVGPAEGGAVSKATPGSGFPSVTSNQQKANYAPQMEEYINNSKKK